MKLVRYLLVLSVLFIACSEENSNEQEIENTDSELEQTEEFNFPLITKNSSVDGIDLPDGAQVEKINNSTIKITLPEGYFMADTSRGLLELSPTTSYTCTCSGSNGCNVFYVKGNYGCSHGNCTGSCTGTVSSRSGKKADREHLFIINKNANLEPSTNEEFEKLPYMPVDLILNLENELTSYAKTLYGDEYLTAVTYVDERNANKSDINDVMLVKMKMYGYKLIYAVNTTLLKPELMKSNRFLILDYEGGSHKCNCESGQSGCTADTSWGVKYCEGGSCTKCTMTID